jgi:DNA (cytosine-5)-methyltransferase 1
MNKPLLLDLYCGAGGAAMGYYRAGFEVIGVDIKPQQHYPFEFHQADALTYPLDGFDAFHASPPCPRYSCVTPSRTRFQHPDLYNPTKQRLVEKGKPFSIENVVGAPYLYGIVLCGSMFGLEYHGEWLRRHRNFETSMMIFQPPCHHIKSQRPVTITGHSFISDTRTYKRGKVWGRQSTFEIGQKLMGIDWMDRVELVDAIPPSYTEYIGKYLMQEVLDSKLSPNR